MGDERRRLGDFEIVREIGRGGMGVVYEAIQLCLSREVASDPALSRLAPEEYDINYAETGPLAGRSGYIRDV